MTDIHYAPEHHLVMKLGKDAHEITHTVASILALIAHYEHTHDQPPPIIGVTKGYRHKENQPGYDTYYWAWTWDHEEVWNTEPLDSPSDAKDLLSSLGRYGYEEVPVSELDPMNRAWRLAVAP